jgi:hypothetical protein
MALRRGICVRDCRRRRVRSSGRVPSPPWPRIWHRRKLLGLLPGIADRSESLRKQQLSGVRTFQNIRSALIPACNGERVLSNGTIAAVTRSGDGICSNCFRISSIPDRL